MSDPNPTTIDGPRTDCHTAFDLVGEVFSGDPETVVKWLGENSEKYNLDLQVFVGAPEFKVYSVEEYLQR